MFQADRCAHIHAGPLDAPTINADEFDSLRVEQQTCYARTHLPATEQQYPDHVARGNGLSYPHRATPDLIK
jgi:hypothetical protein